MNEIAYKDLRNVALPLLTENGKSLRDDGGSLVDVEIKFARRVIFSTELQLVLMSSTALRELPQEHFAAMGTTLLSPVECRAVLHALTATHEVFVRDGVYSKGSEASAAARKFKAQLQEKVGSLPDYKEGELAADMAAVKRGQTPVLISSLSSIKPALASPTNTPTSTTPAQSSRHSAFSPSSPSSPSKSDAQQPDENVRKSRASLMAAISTGEKRASLRSSGSFRALEAADEAAATAAPAPSLAPPQLSASPMTPTYAPNYPSRDSRVALMSAISSGDVKSKLRKSIITSAE